LSGCRLGAQIRKTFVVSLPSFLEPEPPDVQARLFVQAIGLQHRSGYSEWNRPTPIQDGIVYTCTLRIWSNTPDGSYPIRVLSGLAYDATGMAVEDGRGLDGTIVVARDARAGCAADCDWDGRVFITDVVLTVGIALGLSPADRCRAADGNNDSQPDNCGRAGGCCGLGASWVCRVSP
jgi:hypothetical protein